VLAAPSRRQRAARKTRRDIVAAARELFHARGFEAATTEDIAAAAGVAKGTLFLHARTKERLLVMVYEDEFRTTFRDASARTPQGIPLANALAKVFGGFFRVYEKDMALARHFVKEVMFLGPDDAVDITGVTNGVLAGLASMIEERRTHGEVAADVDPALAAANSFLLYFGILTAWLSGWLPGPAARDRALSDSLRLHWRGLEHVGRSKTVRRPAPRVRARDFRPRAGQVR
jgi:AcrR family transcriptional regulator